MYKLINIDFLGGRRTNIESLLDGEVEQDFQTEDLDDFFCARQSLNFVRNLFSIV